jgi:putative lipoic acid-binding regulatory protein
MTLESERALKERLDAYYDWPCVYLFKFIAPRDRAGEVLELLAASGSIRTRESSGGRYLSVTAELPMANSEEVLAIYRRAGAIEGVVSL